MKKISLLTISCLMFVVLLVGIAFAEEKNQDMYTGPGVGLQVDNTIGKIYGYGSIITGSDQLQGEVSVNAGDAAPVYNNNTVGVPIDNYAINMGPTGVNNNQYGEHSLNDGGPGVGLVQNQTGIAQIYGGGPGIGIQENANVDPGPLAVFAQADPAEFLKLYGMTPQQAAELFIASSAADKNNK